MITNIFTGIMVSMANISMSKMTFKILLKKLSEFVFDQS